MNNEGLDDDDANLANVLRNPIESEARLVRHNMKVLTDSLTADWQENDGCDDDVNDDNDIEDGCSFTN